MSLLPSIDVFGNRVRACDHAPLIREQQQRITGLVAENRSLREQLHRKEDLLAAYRRADEADDAERMTTAPSTEGE